MSAASQPSFTQVAELTRGATLPLPAISVLIIQVIADGISKVWETLVADHHKMILTEKEIQVNTLLETRLREFIEEDPLWKNIVISVDRGIETISHDGKNLEFRPDLSFLLTRRGLKFRLTAECKIIDHPKNKTIGLYCARGLKHFVVGDYAWGTRESFMLAYVRDESSIDDRLHGHLSDSQSKEPDPYRTTKLPESHRGTKSLACSEHGRTFEYIHNTPNRSPGPITVWHLWLPVGNPLLTDSKAGN